MLIQFLLLSMAIHAGNGNAFQRHLGLIIPSDRVTYPEKIQTTQVKVILPSLDTAMQPVATNIVNLVELLDEAPLFHQDHENVLWPLYDLKTELVTLTSQVMDSFGKIKNQTEKCKIGVDSYVDQELLFEVTDYFLEFKSRGLTTDLLALNPLSRIQPVSTTTLSSVTPPVNVNISSSGQPTQTKVNKRAVVTYQYRNKEEFLKAVRVATRINQNMQFFNQKLNVLEETIGNLKIGNVEGLQRSFFFQNYMEKQLNVSDFRILDVPYFKKTDNKYEFALNIATIGGHVEYRRFHNIQYYGSKLSHEYFSFLNSDELFELDCIAPQICFPLTTPCSRSLRNESLFKIVTDCPFEQSNLEFELLLGEGILLNEKPVNEVVKAFLEKHSLEPLRYPVLIQVDDCITFHNNLTMCFKGANAVVYSKFNNNLYYYFNPIWYSRLLANFQNVPLVLFSVTLLLITLVLIFGVQTTRYYIKHGKEKFLLYLRDRIAHAEKAEQKQKAEKCREEGEGASAPLKPSSRSPSPEQSTSKGKGGSKFFGKGQSGLMRKP